MHPKRMMIAGVIFVIAAAALFIVAIVVVGEDEDSINKAVRFDGAAGSAAKQGGLVIVEGKVSKKNKILIHDYVDAAKENNDGGTWVFLKEFHQPVLADLAQGEITLNAGHVCSNPEGINALETDERTPNNDPIRFIGLKRGDPITAIGTLTSLAPAALAVKNWYSGSTAEYKDSLASSRRNLYIFCPIMAAAGVGFFLAGWKKRRSPSPGQG